MSSKKWTRSDIPDLSQKVIIVTGGNSGLGFESVKAFAAKGAEVILTSRSLEKGASAKAAIQQEIPDGKIKVMSLDLADLDAVRAFASKFRNSYDRLDVLMNNAGIMMTPYELTRDGFESQMGTNHLGHFALTGLLMNILIKTPQARIVNVSSNAHKYGEMDFDNLLFDNGRDYTPIKAYARSKLANLLFTKELQRLFEQHHIPALSVAAHPGISKTNLARYVEGKLMFRIMMPIFQVFIQDQAQGALPQIRAAVDPSVKGSTYYGPDGFNEMKGFPVLVEPKSTANDLESAQKLWEISENLTGVSFKLN